MDNEQIRQENLDWKRSQSEWYEILGRFQVESVIEVGKKPALLDLACGDGLLTEQFTEHFSPVVGVDASAAHIQTARQRCPDVEFHVSLIEDFETEQRFDTITLLNVLEHVVDPVAILRRAAGWLVPGGCIVAQVPNARAVNRRIGQLMGVLDNLYELSDWDINVAGHRRYYDLADLIVDFDRAGLQMVLVGGIFFKPFSTPQMEWLLQNGLWDSGHFGWGNLEAFCQASYEIGKERPGDCNLIYAVGSK